MTMLVLEGRAHDLGNGFVVRRLLPQAQARTVGPFVSLDQMGPHRFAPGQGIDVRPHPHIGLSTLTWLFDGALMHRDGVGSVQAIRPGDVNWMTSGRGIVHSERTPSFQHLPSDAELVLDASHEERAVFPLDAGLCIDGQTVEARRLGVLPPGMAVMLRAAAPLHERIEQAKADWSAQRFGKVPGESEFIPLSDR